MEQSSSIESRTRASFKRVKRDIDTLKTQIARLRERDEKLDHALSDYARTGELYERIKQVDDRFASLSDSYVPAAEFERAIERLVKETAQITKRLGTLEKKDLAAEIASLRKDLDAMPRRFVDVQDYDEFSKKASQRVAALDESVGKLEMRGKRIDAIEKRLDSFKDLESASAKMAEHDKAIKSLAGFDAKAATKRLDALEKEHAAISLKDLDKRLGKAEQALEKNGSALPKDLDKRLADLASRLDVVESASVSDELVRSAIDERLKDHVRVEELNGKIDEFNAALETVADADRLAQIEAAVGELRVATDGDLAARLDSFDARLDSERHATNAEVSATSTELEKLSEKLDSIASDLTERLGKAEKRLDSERHATNAEVSTTEEEIERLETRLAQFEASLAELREASPAVEDRSDEFAARLDSIETKLPSNGKDVEERLSEIEAQNTAVLAELADVSDAGTDGRVMESITRDLTSVQQRVEELAEEVELFTKSATKGAERVQSVEHLSEEVEFLRNNFAMQSDLESLRSELSSAPKGKGKAAKDDRSVAVLSEDLQKLIERQGELEKKVLGLETQNRQLRAEAEKRSNDPLWNNESKSRSAEPKKAAGKKAESRATIAEKVPLREPKKTAETKDEPKPEEKRTETPKKTTGTGKNDEPKGTVGRMRRWVVDFFTEEVDDEGKDELY